MLLPRHPCHVAKEAAEQARATHRAASCCTHTHSPGSSAVLSVKCATLHWSLFWRLPVCCQLWMVTQTNICPCTQSNTHPLTHTFLNSQLCQKSSVLDCLTNSSFLFLILSVDSSNLFLYKHINQCKMNISKQRNAAAFLENRGIFSH